MDKKEGLPLRRKFKDFKSLHLEDSCVNSSVNEFIEGDLHIMETLDESWSTFRIREENAK